MLGSVLPDANVTLMLRIAGVAILVGGSVVAGYRLHRWADGALPAVTGWLPRDAGAWCGLLAALAGIWFGF